RRETTVAIQFKRAPHPPFEEIAADGLRPNVLLVHIQPDEGVSLAIGAKVPGQGMTIRTVHMDFLYGGAFRTGMPEAYERLILDTMLGDSTLFTRADEVEEQWLLVDSIVAAWQRDKPAFPNYPAGSWGPPSADELLHRRGRQPDRCAGRGRAVGGAGHRPRARDRGRRAHAARSARASAGEHRRAAPRLRPARLPEVAWRAAVGRAGARAARGRHRPADR